MTRVIATLQVEDPDKWEKGFRTHAELFRTQSITKPIHYTMREGNEVVILFEPDDLDTYWKAMDSPATAEAMAFDGVKRETVKFAVLDKTFDV